MPPLPSSNGAARILTLGVNNAIGLMASQVEVCTADVADIL